MRNRAEMSGPGQSGIFAQRRRGDRRIGRL